VAESIIGTLPDVDDSLSSQEVAELHPLTTVGGVTIQARARANEPAAKLANQMEKEQDRLDRKLKADRKKMEHQYIIQLDKLQPFRTKPAKKQKKGGTKTTVAPTVPLTLDNPPVTPSSAAKRRALDGVQKRLDDQCEFFCCR
jgi:hypothetical protein